VLERGDGSTTSFLPSFLPPMDYGWTMIVVYTLICGLIVVGKMINFDEK